MTMEHKSGVYYLYDVKPTHSTCVATFVWHSNNWPEQRDKVFAEAARMEDEGSLARIQLQYGPSIIWESMELRGEKVLDNS